MSASIGSNCVVTVFPGGTSRRHGGLWREAVVALGVGFSLSLLLLAGGASPFLVKIVLGCSIGIAILYYPLLGLILALLLAGTNQLFVLIRDVFSVSKLAMTVALVGYLMHSSIGPDLRQALKSKALCFYILPCIWFFVTIPFGAADIGQILQRITTVISIISLAFLVASMPKNMHQLRSSILLLVLGSAALGVWVMFFTASGLTTTIYENIDGVTTYYDHDFGIELGLTICFSWILLKRLAWPGGIGVLLLNIVLMACILLTQSRSTYAGILVASLTILSWTLLQGKWIIAAKITLIFAALALALMWFIQSNLLPEEVMLITLDRFNSMFEPRSASGVTDRTEIIWPAALAFISDNPLIGAGMAGATRVGAAHNAVLEMGIEGGLIAIFFYLVSVFFTLFGALRARDPWHRVCGLAIVGFIVTVSQTNPGTFYSIPYGFVVGLVAWMEIHTSKTIVDLRDIRPSRRIVV